MFGVPQGSIIGPLSILMWSIPYYGKHWHCKLCRWYTIQLDITGNSIEEVIQRLKKATKYLFKWFTDNQMKANPDKCHFLCSTNREVSLTIENQIINIKFEKLHGIKLDSKLNFNSYKHEIRKKGRTETKRNI